MSAWERDESSGRLIRRDPMTDNSTNTQESPQLIIMNNEDNHEDIIIPPITLRDRCFPSRISQSSCIRITPTIANIELKLNIINLLPIFTETTDAYVFIREFKEVCGGMTKTQQDAVNLRYISFALKDDAKKWLYSLPNNSIHTWEEFVRVFLKKYYPNSKTTKIINEINLFCQNEKESFWKYFDRFQNLLAQCPRHGLEKWCLCQILYECLDFNTRTMLESMCQGGFMDKSEDDAWAFLEDLADKTMLWETVRETPSLSTRIQASRSGVHAIDASTTAEAKLAAIMKRLEALECRNQPQVDLVSLLEKANPTFGRL